MGDPPGEDVDTKNSGTILTVHPSPQYRAVQVRVFTGFYSCPEQQQRELILHEIVHMYLDPAHAYVVDSLFPLIEKGHPAEVTELLLETYVGRNESVTQDLTILLLQVLEGSKSGKTSVVPPRPAGAGKVGAAKRQGPRPPGGKTGPSV
jgi:hypothetical protein